MSRFHMHKQYKRKTRRWPWLFLIIPVTVFLGVIAVAGWYGSSLQPLSPGSEEQIIATIPIGTSTPDVGEILEERKIIKSARAFDWYTRINNYHNDLRAGGYKFSPSQSVEEIVAHLRAGDTAKDLVTILPAQRLDLIKSAFKEAGFSAEEIEVALNPAQYAGHPALVGLPAGASLEGYLYPESFQRSSDTKLTEIVSASLDEMATALDPELLQAYADQGLSTHEAVILASIVEKETSNPDDKPKVAQVFLKRYKEGIMLGSDVTAFYGAYIAGVEPTVFVDTPYNTRLYTGLPPGPISNVSTSSLSAVAHPANTDYLYFVAGDDGVTYFSHTLQEHEALTAQHCIKLCQ